MNRLFFVIIFLSIALSACSSNLTGKNVCVRNDGSLITTDNRGYLVPIARILAEYPAEAYRNRIEGYVDISFIIDHNGKPSELEIIESKPLGIFDKEALKAFTQRIYSPRCINGKLSRKRFSDRIVFEMPES